jgi:hypothetical protein
MLSPMAWQPAELGSKDPRSTVESQSDNRLIPEGQLAAESYVSITPALTEPASAGSNHPSPFELVKWPMVAKGKERVVDLESTQQSRRESEKRSTMSEDRSRVEQVTHDKFIRNVAAGHSQDIASKVAESLRAERATNDPTVSALSQEEIAALVESRMTNALKYLSTFNPTPQMGEGNTPDETIDQVIKNLGAPRGGSEHSSQYDRHIAAAAWY